MVLEDVEKKLNDLYPRQYILSEEFQDKYFLHKQIRQVLPEVPQDIIYDTIEKCNNELRPPREKEKFIRMFIRNIIPILGKK